MKVTVEITVREDDGTTTTQAFSEAQVEQAHVWPYRQTRNISASSLRRLVTRRFRDSLARLAT